MEDGTAGTRTALELARAELELGNGEAAYGLLEGIGALRLNEPGLLPLLAAAAYESGRFEEAARLFQQAAAGAPQPRRGIFTARAADALEQAGFPEAAAVRYEAAASQLKAIAPWLAVRWARVADDRTRALEVLRNSPPETQPFAAEAGASIMLADGDTAGAIASFEEAGRVARAARLAAAAGDASGARRLALAALGSADSAIVRDGFAVVGDEFRPASAEELLVLVRAHLRLGRRQSALVLVREAVDQGDFTAQTLRILGDLERDVGNFWDAVRAYERAGELGGDEGAQADYRRARLLPSLGRATEGYRELALFVERYPDHSLAPRALYLVAERHRRGGRRRTADSLYAVIAERWPTHEYAGRSRLTLAAQARRRGNDVLTADLPSIFDGATAVVHLAAITDAANSFEIKETVEQVNFNGTERVAQACLKANCGLIFPSTTSVYGSQAEEVDEDCPMSDLKPQSPYAEAKLGSEQLLTSLGKEKGLRFITCRFGTIFGTSIGMRFHTAVNKFCWQAVMGQPLTVWKTALHQHRPYLDLGDAVEAIKFIIQKKLYDGKVYNVLSTNTSVSCIVDIISAHVPDISIEYVDTKIMNQLSYHVSNKRFSDLGFESKCNLEQGIGRTIDWLKKARQGAGA